MNRHHISMKDLVDTCGLPVTYNKEYITSKYDDLHEWLTTEEGIHSVPDSNSNLNGCSAIHTPEMQYKNKLVRQLFIWLNLPAKDRAESACQIAYDKGDSKSRADVFLSSTSGTIPSVPKLIRALRKELNYYSIDYWQFVGKVCTLFYT